MVIWGNILYYSYVSYVLDIIAIISMYKFYIKLNILLYLVWGLIDGIFA